MDRFILPFQTALDGNANPMAGAKLYFYETGTSTPKDTYSNASLSNANSNPVIADSAGRFGNIFLGSGDYKAVLQDAGGAQIWAADPVRGGAGGTIATMAQLRANTTPPVSGAVDLLGYYAVGDGGEGSFYWDATSTATDNGGTVIKPTGWPGAGRWVRIAGAGWVSVKWFGARGDGVTDDTAAIQAAIDSLSPTSIAAGVGDAGISGSGTVFFPTSVYNVSDTLAVGPFVVLEGRNFSPWLQAYGGGPNVARPQGSIILWTGPATKGVTHLTPYVVATGARFSDPTYANPIVDTQVGSTYTGCPGAALSNLTIYAPGGALFGFRLTANNTARSNNVAVYGCDYGGLGEANWESHLEKFLISACQTGYYGNTGQHAIHFDGWWVNGRGRQINDNLPAVTSITRSGTTATVTFASAHGLATGDYIRVSGAGQKRYNGFQQVTVTSTTVVTFPVFKSPATPATGTIVAKKSLKVTGISLRYSAGCTITAPSLEDLDEGLRFSVSEGNVITGGQLERVYNLIYLGSSTGIVWNGGDLYNIVSLANGNHLAIDFSSAFVFDGFSCGMTFNGMRLDHPGYAAGERTFGGTWLGPTIDGEVVTLTVNGSAPRAGDGAPEHYSGRILFDDGITTYDFIGTNDASQKHSFWKGGAFVQDMLRTSTGTSFTSTAGVAMVTMYAATPASIGVNQGLVGLCYTFGSPEGVITKPKGWVALDGDTGAVWQKTSGIGNVGWTPNSLT